MVWRSGLVFGLSGVCLLLFAGLARAEGVLTKVPSALADSPKDFWRAFMAELYGPYSKSKKCWISKHQDETFCMRPHTLTAVKQNGKTRLLLSVAGRVAKDGNDCHACTGNIAYYVLDPSGERMAIIAQSEPYLASGAWGAPFPEDRIRVSQIGPNDSFGWVAEGFWMGQGNSVENYAIMGVVGDKVRELGTLPKSYSNEGNCENGKNLMSGDPCSSYAFELTFDTSKPDRFSPAILRVTGTNKGVSLAATYMASFDEKEFVYKLPADMPEDLKN